MKILRTFLLNAIIVFSLNAQDKYNPEIIESNNIAVIEGYIFEENSPIDSFLITKEYFNSKGRRTKIEIYDSAGLQSEYIYNYKDDTLKIERITKFNGKFSSRTKIYYDKKFREIKAIDFNLKGKKTGTHSKTTYNDKKLTEETKIYFANKLAIRTKKKFDENKTLKSYSIKKDGKWVSHFNEDSAGPNNQTTEIEDYLGLGLKLIKSSKEIDQNITILGIRGKLKLAPNDLLVTEKYIDNRELIQYEKQYLNGKLIALKKYKYVAG